MYSGFSKDNGGVIGSAGDQTLCKVDLMEAGESIAAEESLICQDGNDNEVVLVSKLDERGELSWYQGMTKDQVFKRTVGMSQMTSMLHDTDRNTVYETAIKALIENFITKAGRRPVIVDIGTGTGLLALFCIRHGAEFVFGIEMFEAMADIAQNVVNENGASDKIFIINAKSSDMESLPESADIVISELLDSALLGESVVNVHSDAIARLIKPTITGASGEEDCIPMSERVIPSRAKVFATLVESREVQCMHDVSNLAPADVHFNPLRDETCSTPCTGGWPLVPVHWDQLQRRGARELSNAVEVLSFEFFKSSSSFVDEHQTGFDFAEGCFDTDIDVCKTGTLHGVMLYWELSLLPESLVNSTATAIGTVYSTAPDSTLGWQDHWQQTVYPLAGNTNNLISGGSSVQTGDIVRVTCAHNSVRICVGVDVLPTVTGGIDNSYDSNSNSVAQRGGSLPPPPPVAKRAKMDVSSSLSSSSSSSSSSPSLVRRTKRPCDVEVYRNLFDNQCTCGWHTLCGADRIAMLNDKQRIKQWEVALTSMLARIHSNSCSSSVIDSSSDQNQPPSTPSYVMDVSDGSTLSIIAALIYKQQQQGCINKIRFVSKEPKYMSQLFFSQLARSNRIEDCLCLCDETADEEYVSTYFDEDSEREEEDVDEEDKDDEAHQTGAIVTEAAAAAATVAVAVAEEDGKQERDVSVRYSALISECYYYQLHALPTWQALSFHYKRTALHEQLTSNCVISPCRANVMCALVELTDLSGSYGPAGCVHGFDHSALDRVQDDWHTHMFPYKLGNYRHKLLTKPSVLISLDYALPMTDIPASNNATKVPIIHVGRADAAAIWVDYQLSADKPDNCIRGWNGSSSSSLSSSSSSEAAAAGAVLSCVEATDCAFGATNEFPSYLTVNLRFLPAAVAVERKHWLHQAAEFVVGSSDFKYQFHVSN